MIDEAVAATGGAVGVIPTWEVNCRKFNSDNGGGDDDDDNGDGRSQSGENSGDRGSDGSSHACRTLLTSPSIPPTLLLHCRDFAPISSLEGSSVTGSARVDVSRHNEKLCRGGCKKDPVKAVLEVSVPVSNIFRGGKCKLLSTALPTSIWGGPFILSFVLPWAYMVKGQATHLSMI